MEAKISPFKISLTKIGRHFSQLNSDSRLFGVEDKQNSIARNSHFKANPSETRIQCRSDEFGAEGGNPNGMKGRDLLSPTTRSSFVVLQNMSAIWVF